MIISFLEKDKRFFNINNDRYKMLFLFENAYGVFHKREEAVEDKSQLYDITFYRTHICVNLEDALKDIIFLERTGEINLCANDVITIRINGAVESFRFLGMKNLNLENCQKNFCKIQGFIDEEREHYISCLKKENKVLSVLDANIFDIKELNLMRYVVCCIEKEVFQDVNPMLGVMSDYSIYTLKNTHIEKVNPYSRPIKTMDNVLYYLNKKNKDDSLVLLLDRGELEKVRDFIQLRQIAL